MSNTKTKLPIGWNEYNKPYMCEPCPTKTLETYKTIKKIDSTNYGFIDKEIFPEKFDRLYWHFNDDDLGSSITLEFQILETSPNESYESQYQKYLRAKKIFDRKMEQYNEYLKLYKEQQEAKKESLDKKQYLKLKKKFGES